jgi:hypothetical protein
MICVDMNSTLRALLVDLRGFPPRPDRLLELIRHFHDMGISMLLLEFEDLFPWSVDERLQSPYAYPESVVDAVQNECLRLSLPLGCVLTNAGIPDCATHVSSFRRLQDGLLVPDAVEAHATSALGLARHLVDDLLSLLPRLSGLYLRRGRLAAGAAPSAVHMDNFLRPLIEEVSKAIPSLFVDASLVRACRGSGPKHGDAQDERAQCAMRQGSTLHRVGGTAVSPDRLGSSLTSLEQWSGGHWHDTGELFRWRTRLGYAGPQVAPIEAGLHPIASWLSSSGSAGAESGELTERFRLLYDCLEQTWSEMQRLREALVVAARDAQRRSMFRAEFADALERLERLSETLHAHRAPIDAALEGLVEEEALHSFWEERFGPLREEAGRLGSRARELF